MLNKLLKTSLILVLAITLTACAGNKKKTPGNTAPPLNPETSNEMTAEEAKLSGAYLAIGGNGIYKFTYEDLNTLDKVYDLSPSGNSTVEYTIGLVRLVTENPDLLGKVFNLHFYDISDNEILSVSGEDNPTKLQFVKELPAKISQFDNAQNLYLEVLKGIGEITMRASFDVDGTERYITLPKFTIKKVA